MLIASFLLTLGSLYTVTDACGKRPNFKPIDIPTTTDDATHHGGTNDTATDGGAVTPPTTTPTTRHTTRNSLGQLGCTPEEEYQESKCLNGGQCFKMIFFDYPEYHCHCPKQFTGKRCELLHQDPQRPTLSMPKKISIGVCVSILFIVFVIVIAVWSYKRVRRKREARKQDSNGNNAAELKPMAMCKEDELNGNELDERTPMNEYEEMNLANEVVLSGNVYV